MSFVTRRLSSFFRSNRVRVAIVLIGGYKAYTYIRTDNILHKRFSAPRHRPGQTVIDLDLDTVRIVTNDSRSAFGSVEEIKLHHLIDTLNAAKKDPRVTGLVVRGISGLRSVGLAEISELRDTITDFSTGWGGKYTMLHIPEGLGGAGNGTLPLYFASAFNSIHVQPTSGVIVPGLSLGTLFFKNLLEKAGLKAKKVARKEFKTAANNFTEDKFTEAHRQSTESLLNAIMADIVHAVAEGRNLSEKQVMDAIDTGIMNVHEAQELGLLDKPLYRDQLPKFMRQKLYSSTQHRKSAREEAEVEWRDAMLKLKESWSTSAGTNWYDLWEHGRFVANLTDMNFAIASSIIFCEKQPDVVESTIKDELRALKAHLKWLDSCPWETDTDEKDQQTNVYNAIPYISSLMQTEREICANAITALEGMPKFIENHRDPTDKSTFRWEKEHLGALLRWCRGAWRAKCMVARIVHTITDREEYLNGLRSGDADADDPSELSSKLYKPRLFLAGHVEEYEVKTDDEGEKTTENADEKVDVEKVDAEKVDAEKVGAEKVGAERVDAEGVDAEKESSKLHDNQKSGEIPEASPKVEKGLVQMMFSKREEEKPEPYEEMNLRYVRLSDYLDTISTEQRAAYKRASPFIYRRNPGGTDPKERNTMFQLQRAGQIFKPWRIYSPPKGNFVAIIHVDGVISDETADITRAAIRRADKDPLVKATVLRINSPGGSATASDLISRAVDVAKKPVVASMSSVCASGGYFISAPCDKVFASKSTITGSIGVIFTAFNTSSLFENIGITSDRCSRGRFADYFGPLSSITEWSEDFEARVNGMIDNFYADFLNVVSRGRKLTLEETEKVARGRVWAGSEALEVGLVDEIGGLKDAIKAAGDLAHLTPDMEITAIEYPTTGMLLQDAARRRGLMPANLDEEGDEAIAEKRKRNRFWFFGSDDSERKDEYDDMELHTQPSAAVGTGISVYPAEIILSKVFSYVDQWLLLQEGSGSTRFIEHWLRVGLSMLQRENTAMLTEEMEKIRATSGKAAAIAPRIQVNE